VDAHFWLFWYRYHFFLNCFCTTFLAISFHIAIALQTHHKLNSLLNLPSIEWVLEWVFYKVSLRVTKSEFSLWLNCLNGDISWTVLLSISNRLLFLQGDVTKLPGTDNLSELFIGCPGWLVMLLNSLYGNF